MLVDLALPIILTIIMFSLGLGLTPADFGRVLREPRAFWIGAFNQILIVPAVAFAMAVLFGLPQELAVGIMILGLCPGGVLSNVATRFAYGNVPLSVSLTALISLLSILTLPPLVGWSVGYFMGADAPPVNVTALGVQMFVLTAVPVGLGMALTAALPRHVPAISYWMSRVSLLLFIVALAAALAANWGLFIANIGTLGPALLAMTATLIVVGLLTSRLAGLGYQDTSTVTIESAIQNGTLGIAVGVIVAGASGGLPPTTLPTAIYSITAWLLAIPFILWRRSGRNAAPLGQPV
jgi:BASS family bile acid:Na+ symporter